MIRYFEYVYLLVAVGLLAFLAVDYEELTFSNKMVMYIGIGIASFMFSFRRKQRIAFQKADEERLEKLREEAGEGDD